MTRAEPVTARDAVAERLTRFQMAVRLSECSMADCADEVIDALRKLPVEQRMEAMGMIEVRPDRHSSEYAGGPSWRERRAD